MWDETCNSGDWGEVLSPQVPCGCDPSNHEKYDEEVGSSQYGPYWEQGVRCLRCGRKWADPEVEERRRREWLAKQASEFVCMVGSEGRLYLTVSGHWGDTEADLRENLEGVRQALVGEYEHPCPESATEEERADFQQWVEDCLMHDRGSIALPPPEELWFVFMNDCGECEVLVEEQEWAGPYTDEWNLLNNFPGLKQPMHPAALEAWRARRVGFAEAARRIADPRPRPYGVASDLEPRP